MKPIVFSTKYPAYHRKSGYPTYFVEKIQRELSSHCGINYSDMPYRPVSNEHETGVLMFKKHTIRKGNSRKQGEYFSPRIWSGKPYQDKQITFAPDLEIRRVYDIQMVIEHGEKFFLSKTARFTLSELAANDGLTVPDFLSWFTEPFEGQIICWSDVKYNTDFTGRKITFPENNKIGYFQDFRMQFGVPNIEFTIIYKANDDSYWLEADGYGVIGGNYGNGRISISNHEIARYL